MTGNIGWAEVDGSIGLRGDIPRRRKSLVNAIDILRGQGDDE